MCLIVLAAALLFSLAPAPLPIRAARADGAAHAPGLAGAALISAGATQGSCAGTATVVCALGAIQAGAAVTATVVVVAPPALTIINEAFVAAAEPDADPWDNRVVVQTATDRRRRYLPVVLR